MEENHKQWNVGISHISCPYRYFEYLNKNTTNEKDIIACSCFSKIVECTFLNCPIRLKEAEQ